MEFLQQGAFASLMTSLSNDVVVSPKAPTQMEIGPPVAKVRSAFSKGPVGPFVVSRGDGGVQSKASLKLNESKLVGLSMRPRTLRNNY
jgi:hypothetical protein